MNEVENGHSGYRRSENVNELAAALAKAQGEIANAAKDADNPFFRSKYADLASVWDAIRRPLSANGLAVLQPAAVDGARVTVTTLLTHASGQWVESSLTMMAMQQVKGSGWEEAKNPQAIGSAITYARRYSLSAMVGVAPEDDDGNAATGRHHRKPEDESQEPDAIQAARDELNKFLAEANALATADEVQAFKLRFQGFAAALPGPVRGALAVEAEAVGKARNARAAAIAAKTIPPAESQLPPIAAEDESQAAPLAEPSQDERLKEFNARAKPDPLPETPASEPGLQTTVFNARKKAFESATTAERVDEILAQVRASNANATTLRALEPISKAAFERVRQPA